MSVSALVDSERGLVVAVFIVAIELGVEVHLGLCAPTHILFTTCTVVLWAIATLIIVVFVHGRLEKPVIGSDQWRELSWVTVIPQSHDRQD